MKRRCRAGDLALVVRDEDGCLANVGKMVRVKGPLRVNRRQRLVCWLIEPVKAEPWHWLVAATGKTRIEVITFASRIEHPDAWLVPLRPALLEGVISVAEPALHLVTEDLAH
jgi:hypothetical protein